MSADCPDDYDVFDPLLYAWDHLGREVLVPGPCVGERPDGTWTAANGPEENEP